MKILQYIKKYKAYILVFTIIFAIFALDCRLKTVVYTINSDKVENPVRIALIADLHGCYYGENQKTLVNAIKNGNPDILLLAGDIFDDDVPYQNSKIFLKEIAHLYPCYYVTGNHEYWSYDVDNILDIISSYNVTILDGEQVILDINGEKINICGISDPDKEHYTQSTDTPVSQLDFLEQNVDFENFTVLLTHRPEFIDTYLNYSYDLAVAGHAHGGQWRIPFILNGIYAPNQGIFPKYAGGFYSFDNMDFIVSRGLARESTIVPRIFNRPELIFIDIN